MEAKADEFQKNQGEHVQKILDGEELVIVVVVVVVVLLRVLSREAVVGDLAFGLRQLTLRL